MVNNWVDEVHIAKFYDEVLHPAIIHIIPHSAPSYPPYCLLDGILSHTKDVKVVGGKRLFASSLLHDLVLQMRHCLQIKAERLKWACSFFFGLEIKGIKLSTTHPIPLEDAHSHSPEEETAWTQILGLFNHQLSAEEQRSTWVDVRLEIHRREFVLHWDASKHHNVLQVLAHGCQGEVERGILSLAGGHCALPHHAWLPVYAQWYASEKAVARRADKFHPMLEISKKNVFLEKNQKKLQREFDNLDQVWSLANEEHTEGTARMEIHVPLGKARNALRGIREFIEECTISVPARQWWLFKLLTTCACHQLIEAQRNATPKSRVQPYALELTAALLWCINMLNSRPATGSSEHALMCASLPVTDNFLHPDVLDGCDRNPHRDQAEGEQCCPFAPGNVLWFRDISYGGPSNHG
ncbi:uncharacterized protein EI90DRAFT_3133042 [Cantharellus anzutake]|uniref:uncharacterized protein n=1 Tax=Cantharellus anzutake TaxID=1750568 RepID=UPI001904816E|nr:uncharacterized protein EI90DRAFT_3133042 [Cantharellus anzutake]KAF8318838.1 hypothetical protein EI90DRAFT_3133042 [Cantharellus anzutake]